MFMEGVMYSAISKNMAMGFGSFWFPRFSEIGLGGMFTFHDHPPFVFWLQSLFFKYLGTGFFTERFYCLTAAGFTLYLIIVLWKRIGRVNLNVQYMEWLAILFWAIIPLTYWSFRNNLLENTMGIFILLTVICQFKYIEGEKPNYLLLMYGGICLFLSTFSKGITGAYPIVVFLLHWALFRKQNLIVAIRDTLITLAIPVIIYTFMVYFSKDAADSLSRYASINYFSEIPSARVFFDRFDVIFRIFWELLPNVIVVLLSWAWFSYKGIDWKESLVRNKNYILLFLFIGLSGSLPLILYLEQKGIYISTTLPFFAIAMALMIAPGWKKLLVKVDIDTTIFKSFKFIFGTLIVLVLAISAMLWERPQRDGEILNEIHVISEFTGDGVVISVNKGVWNNWAAQAYFMRYHQISLSPSNHEEFMILDGGELPPLEYVFVDLNLENYRLFRRKSS